jgi:hypothetical protein
MLIRTPEAVQRDLNAVRFRWHEHVIRDLQLTAAALRFASLVMHRYRSSLGYAAISHRGAAKQIGVTERTILRARDLLVSQVWLIRLNAEPAIGFPNSTAHYTLGGGPNDLDFRAHAGTDDSP